MKRKSKGWKKQIGIRQQMLNKTNENSATVTNECTDGQMGEDRSKDDRQKGKKMEE